MSKPESTLKLNPNLASLPVYQPGRPIEDVARELGMPSRDIIKLASNENPNGPSPAALAAMEKALRQLHLYPDGNAFYLKRRLAEKLGVTPSHLVLGNGSNEIIEFVGHALMGPGAEVVASQYCFAVYPIVARLFGAELVTVPARDYGHDLPAMARAITPRTRVVFVANPNNPTGTLASPNALRAFIAQVPAHALLVMDEAYIEFLENAEDLIPTVLGGGMPNLILMRTFSKIYGLAGLRLGYGIAHPDLIAALEKVRQPFNINALAQAGALAALDDVEHLTATRRRNLEGLDYLSRELAALRLETVPSAANFILARVGDGQRVFDALQRRGVITRPMAGYQLPEWIRISVGTRSENERCVEALRAVLAGPPP
ncbi:MAG: histidinol-phosphate transaminase [Verrucomicrobia bacterium]|nr:histidinol-phosphate transaminase [Verrucomicrobiota bacterium]